MDKNVAIEVEHLSKTFRLPTEKVSSIKQSFVNFIKGTKGYKRQVVLNDISFVVREGDFFGIVGRNGSGKSTLLKLLSGIYEQDGGSIKRNGSLVSFIELGVGFNSELTGKENIYLNGALLGFSRKEMDGMYEEIVDFAELHEFMGQKLKNYSSGMQVRLAFSIAIRAKGDILVLDEVLAVGDEAFQRKCYAHFAKLKKTKKTVILVTHSMDTVREYCNKAILVDNGKIVESGDVNRVARGYSELFASMVGDADSHNEERWGTGEIRVTEIESRVKKDKIEIDMEILSTIEADSITVAIRLSLLDGSLVAGMSTKRMLNCEKLAIKAGEVKKILFVIPNNLGKKDVRIGTLIVNGNNTITYDNWDGASKISNPNQESFYPIVYDNKVVIRRVPAAGDKKDIKKS